MPMGLTLLQMIQPNNRALESTWINAASAHLLQAAHMDCGFLLLSIVCFDRWLVRAYGDVDKCKSKL